MAWSSLLLPLSPVYRLVVTARAAAYRRGWVRHHRFDVPVVSVGNLSFGGTGKTPTVISLVQDLVRRGRRPAVLTRGYGRTGRTPLIVVGPEPDCDAATAGDEPIEMARRLPGVPIIVDADRIRGGATALTRGADVLVLDDGFQHLRVARDLDLVLIDAGDPWAGGFLPPRGRLREPLTALGRATAVLITKISGDSQAVVSTISERLQEVAPGLPVLASRIQATRLRFDGEWHSVDRLHGARVFAFAGLGRPQGFRRLLEDNGADVVGHRWFDDHHHYTPDDEAELAAAAQAASCPLVTTAKDAVKLGPGFDPWIVESAVQPLDGRWHDLWRLMPGGGV